MKKNSHFIILFVVFLFSFLPVISFLFALKNDTYLGYFPPKFLLSETIKSGHFPLWNPYISFGLPFYGDMNGAYWNPITWLIASTTGYNPYTLTLEFLLYIFLGGVGMHYLSSLFTQNKYIRIIAACAYMCNGFISGHLQHLNWLSASAFLPFCVCGIILIGKSPTFRTIIFTVFAFYLLASSSHPGLTIGSIYFFLLLIPFLIIDQYKIKGIHAAGNTTKRYVVFLILLLFLSAAMIVSYLDILPYFARNGKIDISLSLTENTTIQSWISLLVPFSTVKNKIFFANDIALRNNYFGISLLLFFILSFFTPKTKEQIFFLITGGLFFMLSLGGVFKLFAHQYLPLIGYVRINGEFRIFSILCFILFAVAGFDGYLKNEQTTLIRLKKIIYVFLGVCTIFVTLSLFQIITNGNTVFYKEDLWQSGNLRDSVKHYIDGLTFYDTLLIQSLIQITLLLLLLKAFTQLNLKRVLVFSCIDITLATLLNIPFTGVGKVSTGHINALYKKSPPGIPVPSLQALKFHDTIPNQDSALIGDWSYYNKQIGKASSVLYPVKIKSNLRFYTEVKKDSSLSVENEPFLFLADNINSPKILNRETLEKGDIKSFTTNSIHLKFKSNKSGYLVLLQNYYPHWHYKTSDGSYPVLKAGPGFMGIPVKKGENDILIYFNPVLVKIFFIIDIVIFVLLVIFLAMRYSKRYVFE